MPGILPIEQERGRLHKETNSKTNEEWRSLLEEMRVNRDLSLQQETRIMKSSPPTSLPSFLSPFFPPLPLLPFLSPSLLFFFHFFNLPITHSTCSPNMPKIITSIEIDIVLLANGDLHGLCLSEFCFPSRGAVYFWHQNFPFSIHNN